jgi:hypothetical protein
MSENQQNWINWARTLQRWGIKEGVASLLETIGSLGILAAQIVYLSQPLFSGVLPSSSLHSVAQVLENPNDRREFISFLREKPTGGSGA